MELCRILSKTRLETTLTRVLKELIASANLVTLVTLPFALIRVFARSVIHNCQPLFQIHSLCLCLYMDAERSTGWLRHTGPN